ncbi:MAG: citramalate synthase [Dehalococcoidia bacterium]|nr:citramalate synthase [Dehalococcoidia bacterium]
MGQRLEIYDTTLRDGAQREGISYSVEDKLKIARKLMELGIPYIEGGYAASNPKDEEFFRRAQGLDWGSSLIAAFGSTRRAGTTAAQDPSLRAMVDAKTRVVTIVGKSWDLHVTDILETTLEENQNMIADSVAFLKSRGRLVFFDAEHYFDGFKRNPDYALNTIKAAARAGADRIILCDTNGGVMPKELQAAIKAARAAVPTALGIHVHSDTELAVANSVLAVEEGCIQVQGCINGYGERCGNANLCSLIPNLQLKLGYDCLPPEKLTKLTEVAHFVSETANLIPDPHQPYVGTSAFAHKAGLHVAAVLKHEMSYQHMEPTLVGNHKRVVVSELSGRGNIVYKAEELGLTHLLQGNLARELAQRIKEMESRGYQFEGAEASFELLLRRSQNDYRPPFEVLDFSVGVEKRQFEAPEPAGNTISSRSTVKLRVAGEELLMAGEGNGPVNALDAALRKALNHFYPSLAVVHLTDYKVRILDEAAGTAAWVRVLIESSDGQQEWTTVGASQNIIEASWTALTDSLEYWLARRQAL